MADAFYDFMDPLTPEGDIMGIDWSFGNPNMQERQAATKSNEPGGANYEAAAAKKKAEEEAAGKTAARLAIQNAPTSGYSDKGNTARQFLTSF